uniref:MalT-like TPR region domain-containing protein n=1 Tax=Ditylum brightwellii TaxID=49249 RepID=A0A7S4UX16_9STRA
MDTPNRNEERSTVITQSTEMMMSHINDYGRVTPLRLLPSKKELYRLASELNDVGVEYHRAGTYHKALLEYQEAANLRMVASQIANGDMTGLANLPMTNMIEKYETVKAQKEELILKSADRQPKDQPLDLYRTLHQQARSRTTSDNNNIPVEEPICSATQVNEEEMSLEVDTAVTLYNMGLVHQENNRMMMATQFFSLAQQSIPQTSYPFLTALIRYSSAKALYIDGDLTRAAHNLSKATQIYWAAVATKTLHGEEGVELNLASAISLMGRIHFEMKDYDEAAKLCQQVLQIRCAVLGEDDVHTAAASYNLALVLAETGGSSFIQEAIQLVRLSFQVFLDDRKESPSSVVSRSNIIQVVQTLGGLFMRIGRLTLSMHCVTKSLQLARKAASEDPTDKFYLVDIADSLFAFGKILHMQGQWQSALKHYHEALQVERVIGEEHKEIALVLCCLGQVYYRLGDLDSAFEYHERALHFSRRFLDDQCPFMAGLQHNIGNIQNERGNTEDAIARLADSERIRARGSQAHNDANSVISLMSPSDTEQTLHGMIDLFQSYGIDFYPAAGAA